MTLEGGRDQLRSGQSQGNGRQNYQDLVKQVAEKVYQMWKRDLRIERERQVLKSNRIHRSGG